MRSCNINTGCYFSSRWKAVLWYQYITDRAVQAWRSQKLTILPEAHLWGRIYEGLALSLRFYSPQRGPPPNFTLGTMQSAKYRSPGNRQNPDSSIRLRDWEVPLLTAVNIHSGDMPIIWIGQVANSLALHLLIMISQVCFFAKQQFTWHIQVVRELLGSVPRG